jgi:hypothetical protein
MGLMKEEFTATFGVRALFTATLAAVLFFMFRKRMNIIK